MGKVQEEKVAFRTCGLFILSPRASRSQVAFRAPRKKKKKVAKIYCPFCWLGKIKLMKKEITKLLRHNLIDNQFG